MSCTIYSKDTGHKVLYNWWNIIFCFFENISCHMKKRVKKQGFYRRPDLKAATL